MPYCHQCRKDFKVLPACPQCSLPLVPRATAGMVISVIAGVIVLITAFIIMLFWASFFQPFLMWLGLGFLVPWGLALMTIGFVSGILMIIGGALMYLPGKERAGAVIVLLFSIVSLIVLGGFIVGATLGIVGAALGFAKK